MSSETINPETIEDLGQWAHECGKKRKDRQGYLENPPALSDFWIKRKLLERALKPIASERRGDSVNILESKGANMEVYDFVAEDFEALIKEWLIIRKGTIDKTIEERIHEFASYIAQRFVFKVGNTEDFVIRLGNRTDAYPRDDMEETFAPLGFPVKHTMLRVRRLAKEVLLLNAYSGNEEKIPITGPYLYEEIRRFLNDPHSFEHTFTTDHFIIHDDGSKKETVSTLYEGSSKIDYADYIEGNKTKRSHQLKQYEESLQPFFDAVVTIGAHDTVRRVSGYDRHTELSYAQAAEIIEELCERHKDASFLVPEHTTYGYDPRLSREEWKAIDVQNEESVRVFMHHFLPIAPSSLQSLFEHEPIAREFCHHVMEHHHDIPEYPVDPATTVLSSAMLKFVFNFVYHYILRSGCRKREDFDKNQTLNQFLHKLTEDDAQKLHSAVITALKKYSKDVKKKIAPAFTRYEKTQVKTQDRLDYDEGNEIVEGPLSIRELINDRPHLLKKYPEIAEKLVVCYYQIHKMYQDTGYFPDLRPVHFLRDVFARGEWAIQTDNIQIAVFKDPEGREYVKIVNIDPEDHFRRAPDNEEERNPEEGLAKYAFNLGENIGSRSIRKAISRFIEEVARYRGIAGDKAKLATGSWLSRWIGDFTRENKETATILSKSTYQSVLNEIRNFRRTFAEKFQKTALSQKFPFKIFK